MHKRNTAGRKSVSRMAWVVKSWEINSKRRLTWVSRLFILTIESAFFGSKDWLNMLKFHIAESASWKLSTVWKRGEELWMTTKCGRQSKLATRLMTASSFMLCRQQEFFLPAFLSVKMSQKKQCWVFQKKCGSRSRWLPAPANAAGLTCSSMTRTATWLKQGRLWQLFQWPARA